MGWIDKKPKLKVTQMFDYGGSPVIAHSVMCWLCDERSAVYSAYPNFIFLPCSKCQEFHTGYWNKRKKWWQRP